MKFLSRAGKKIIKEAKNGLDHATGKDKIKKQYKHSKEQSYALENEIKAKLYLQLCTEQNKIAEYRQKIQLLTEEETEKFLKEQKELPKLQAEKEAIFKENCVLIEKTMKFMRAALCACTTGKLEVVKAFLFYIRSLPQFKNPFFNLCPLHIAAEHNHPKIITLLGSNAINFTRFNTDGQQAIDLAEIQGNNDAKKALSDLEQKTAALWVILEQNEYNTLCKFPLLVPEGADLNAVNEQNHTVLSYAILKNYSLLLIQNLLQYGAELNLSWTLEQKKAFVQSIADPEIRIKLIETFIETEEQALTIQNDNVLLSEGPQWSDAYGWDATCYRSTIKSVTIEVNGCKQLLVLGRSGLGIHLHSYDFMKKSWVPHPMGPEWSDKNGCAAEPYFSTIRATVAKVNDKEQLFILMRNAEGIDLWRYDPINLIWTPQPSGTNWSDKNGYSAVQYYSTLRLAVANVEGVDQLFVLMRCAHGVELWNFNPNTLTWAQQPTETQWSDQNGYNIEAYYSTIHLVVGKVIRGQDRVDQLFTLARHSKGFELWKYDPLDFKWVQLPSPLPNWFDYGWKHEIPFSVFDVVVGRGWGMNLIYVFVRQANIISIFYFMLFSNHWNKPHNSPLGLQPLVWPNAFYKDTVQLQVLKNYDYSTNNLVIFARSDNGLEAYLFDASRNRWDTLFYPAPLSHTNRWDIPFYYQSIQTHVALINDQRKILVLARSCNGLNCWSSSINLRALDEIHELTVLKHYFTYGLDYKQALAFLLTTKTASRGLITAAEQGNWLSMQENLSQGAYINAVNTQGYNALEVAIISKKINLEILNGLIAAGIFLDPQRAETLKTMAFMNEYMPKITLLLSPEPVMGVYKTLKTAVDVTELKTSFQEHCDRAQRFLDQYPEDKLKIEAILIYYLWLSKTEPYALYVMPTLLLLSQLSAVMQKTETSLPEDFVKEFPQKQILEAAQLFFKRTRAMHCILNEIGTQTYTLNTETEFMNFEWSYVLDSIQLKREALTIAKDLEKPIYNKRVVEAVLSTHKDLCLKGTASVLRAFSKQVFSLNILEDTDLDKMAIDFLQYQKEYGGILITNIKEPLGNKVVEVVRQAFDYGLIHLPPKQSFRQSLHLWEEVYQESKLKKEATEAKLKLEEEAIVEWLAQRKVQYLEWIEKSRLELVGLAGIEAKLIAQYNIAYSELSENFMRYREDLRFNFEEAKAKAESNFAKSAIAIAAAAIFAPQFAPNLAASLGASLGIAAGTTTMATLELMMEGVLTSTFSSVFLGKTKDMAKNAFIAGWTAGFGSALSGALKNSSTLAKMDKLFTNSWNAGQRVVSTTVVKALQTLPASFANGRVGLNLLNTIGTSLALGSAQEMGFVEKLNTHCVSILVSATVSSVVTRSHFLGNAIVLSVNTALQGIGNHIGKEIAHARAMNASQMLLEDRVGREIEHSPSARKRDSTPSRGIPRRHHASAHPMHKQGNHVQSYYVPENTGQISGLKNYERFVEKPLVFSTQNHRASNDSSLSKKPKSSTHNSCRTKSSSPILDFFFGPVHANELPPTVPSFSLSRTGTGQTITNQGMQTGRSTPLPLLFSRAKPAKVGSQSYISYANSVKLSRKQKHFTSLDKTTDDFMNEKYVEVQIKIYTIGAAGHLAYCVLIWNEDKKKMQNETIGLYPKPPESPLYALAPLVRAQGIIKFEDAEYDSHLSSKQLLTGSIWISEKNFLKLCNNAAKSIKNPGGYNIIGLGSANCIRHVISAFEAIGETNIIARAFNVIDFHEMKNNLIKLQLGFYFKESQELCLYSYIAGMQGNSDYTVMSKDFSDYWEHSRKVGQNFKDAELARQGNTSVTSHKP